MQLCLYHSLPAGDLQPFLRRIQRIDGCLGAQPWARKQFLFFISGSGYYVMFHNPKLNKTESN
jgi:hypothetical protein